MVEKEGKSSMKQFRIWLSDILMKLSLKIYPDIEGGSEYEKFE